MIDSVVHRLRGSRARGFTLLELAIVLLVLSLTLGTLLGPLPAYLDQRRWRQAQTDLQAIRSALTAFAVVSGRLPCPARESDPALPAYGLEDCTVTAPLSEGLLPWRTLGVSATDPWGVPRQTVTDSWRGHWHYRADRNFTSAPITLATSGASGPDRIRIVDAAGRALTNLGDPPAALVYSLGANGTADGENGSYETGPGAVYQAEGPPADFDDQLIWIGRFPLFDRMLQAHRLP